MSRMSIFIPGFAHTNPVPTACKIGNVVVSGGISGMDPETGILPSSFDHQCHNIFQHLKAVMVRADGSVDDIAMLEFWVNDMRDRAALNVEWLAMFPDPGSRPTRQVFSGARGYDPAVLIVCAITAIMGQK